MIRNILICQILLVSFSAGAQQVSQYSLYMLNQANFNPAYVGMEKELVFTGIYRKQWVGIRDSPSEQALNVNMPVYFLRSGVGLSFESDMIGARQYSNYKLQWSYHLPILNGVMGFGASVGMTQLAWDGRKLRTPEGLYVSSFFEHNDPDLPNSRVGGIVGAFGLGLYYKTDRLELGVASNYLSEPSIDIEAASLDSRRHFNFYGAFNYALTRRLDMKPTVMIQSELVNTQTNVSLRFVLDGKIFVGLGYRGYHKNSFDSMPISFGWKMNEKTFIVYGYDVSVSSLSSVNDGSHEILLKYRVNKEFGKGKLPKVIYNPRFY